MILIASSSPALQARVTQGLHGFAPVLSVSHVDSLYDGLDHLTPRLLMLDYTLPGLDGLRGVAALRRAYPAVAIVMLTASVSDTREIELFKIGVRGCCRIDTDPQLLKRVASAVSQGELWIRRSLTPRLLDELRERALGQEDARPDPRRAMAELTDRERQIVALIGSGETNKQIARQLSITERTVKGHLTEIFRKLGVAQRVKLALLVASRPDIGGRKHATAEL